MKTNRQPLKMRLNMDSKKKDLGIESLGLRISLYSSIQKSVLTPTWLSLRVLMTNTFKRLRRLLAAELGDTAKLEADR